MESEVNNDSNESTQNGVVQDSERQSNIDELHIEDTTVSEYFEVVQKEYEYERSKKESFENRAGILLTIIGGIIVVVVEKVPLKNVFENEYLTIRELISILVYSCFVYIIFELFKVIKVEKHDTLDVSEISCELMQTKRVDGVATIVLTYVEVIKAFREKNNNRAKAFNRSLVGLIIVLILIGVYINLV